MALRSRPLLVALATVLVGTSCSAGTHDPSVPRSVAGTTTTRPPATTTSGPRRVPRTVDVYAHTRAGDLSPAVAGVPPRVYVPNSHDGTVDVIDPTTYRVVAHFRTGALPQHVTPSWDLRTLYVDND